MRWKISHHGHDPRQIDLLAVLALLIVIVTAWRYFDDFPKDRQRFEHAFENRQDALVSWLDDSGLDDAGFALARHLVGEVFAMLELGGREVESIEDR